MKKQICIFLMAAIALPFFGKGSKDPEWISNPYYKLNQDDYISAVSGSENLETAKKQAIYEVSTEIMQKISATQTVSQKADSSGQEFQSYLSNITTESNISEITGLGIKDTVKTKGKNGIYYARAVLDISKAAKYYSLEITKNSMEIDTILENAEKNTDVIANCKSLSAAYKTAVLNDDYMTLLASIKPEYRKQLSYGSSAEIAARLKDEFSKIVIAVSVENDSEEAITNAFTSVFNSMGIKTVEGDENSATYTLDASLKLDDIEKADSTEIFFTRVTVSASVIENDTLKSIFSFSQNKREGKLTRREAQQSAVRAGEKIVQGDFKTYFEKIFMQ